MATRGIMSLEVLTMTEYRPDNFPYMSSIRLVEQLDFLVKDPDDPDYLILKERLRECAKKAANRNPFGAARPERFYDREKLEMVKMKNSGKTYREIAEYYECSTSIVYRCIEQAKNWE